LLKPLGVGFESRSLSPAPASAPLFAPARFLSPTTMEALFSDVYTAGAAAVGVLLLVAFIAWVSTPPVRLDTDR
jgi:hypothetical protein